jgi:hypothetical protein
MLKKIEDNLKVNKRCSRKTSNYILKKAKEILNFIIL